MQLCVWAQVKAAENCSANPENCIKWCWFKLLSFGVFHSTTKTSWKRNWYLKMRCCYNKNQIHVSWPWDWVVDRGWKDSKETISRSWKISEETTIEVWKDGKPCLVLVKKLAKLLPTIHEAEEPPGQPIESWEILNCCFIKTISFGVVYTINSWTTNELVDLIVMDWIVSPQKCIYLRMGYRKAIYTCKQVCQLCCRVIRWEQ